MNGQLSIFDVCYKFKRYIGQQVKYRDLPQIMYVFEIEPYYTHLVDASGDRYVGTPTTISPIEEVYDSHDD